MLKLKGLYAFMAFVCCLSFCADVRGQGESQPVHLTIEVTKAATDAIVLRGWSQDGIAAKFEVDDTYSILIRTTVVLLKEDESVLLELELYEKEELILTPSFFIRDGESVTFVINSVPNPKHPTIVRAAGILRKIILRPEIMGI